MLESQRVTVPPLVARARVQVAVQQAASSDGKEEVVSVVSQARTSFIPSLSDRVSVTI